jgi:hypothetical protein
MTKLVEVMVENKQINIKNESSGHMISSIISTNYKGDVAIKFKKKESKAVINFFFLKFIKDSWLFIRKE